MDNSQQPKVSIEVLDDKARERRVLLIVYLVGAVIGCAVGGPIVAKFVNLYRAEAVHLAPTQTQSAYARADCLRDSGTLSNVYAGYGPDLQSADAFTVKPRLLVTCTFPRSPGFSETDITYLDSVTSLPTNTPLRVFTIPKSAVKSITATQQATPQ